MKTIHSILILLVASSSLLAQPREGKNKELSLSGSYQSYSSGSSSGGSGALLISPRLGFFVHKGLELEPELLFMAGSGSDPVYMVNGNISYNFISAGKGVPFLLIGYGIANTVPFFNVPFTRTDFMVGVLNVGGGVKAFLQENIAIRFEYRFQEFSGSKESDFPAYYGYYSYTHKVDARLHTIQFGISILL
jgi:opacity protein-like surface antigen